MIVDHAPWWLAAAALIAVSLWVAAPIVTRQRGPIWDADGFFAPFYSLVADFARRGRLLLWNPWSSGGSPDFAEPQIGASSPLVVLSAFVTGGGGGGFRWHWLATWFAGPLGLLLLARRSGVPPLGAFAVALGFAFSSPYTGNAEHTSYVRALALLPFIIERVEAALSERAFLPAAQAGVLWGLSALGGYPALVFIDLMFVGLWILGRWLFRVSHAEPRAALPGLRRFAAVAIPAGVLGVVVLLPPFIGMFTEANGYSTRTEPLTRDYVVTSNALGPAALSTIFSSDLAALPSTLWPATDISSAGVYFGAVALFFAVCALAGRPRNGWRWWLLGMAAFFLALAVGPSLPLRGWLYDFVPPTRFFRHASVFRLPGIWALLMLSLEGARDVLEEPRRGLKTRATVLATVVLIGAAVGVYATVSRLVPAPGRGARDAHFALVWSGVLVAAAALVVGRGGSARARLVRRGGAALLVAIAVFDAARSFSLSPTVGSHDTAAGWRALDRTRVGSLDLLANGSLQRLAVIDDSTGFGPGPTNKNLLTKQPSFLAYPSLRNPIFEQWAATRPLLERVLPEQRCFFAANAVAVDRSLLAFEQFAAYATRSGAFPLVVSPSPNTAAARPEPTAGGLVETFEAAYARPLPVRFTTYDPDRLTIELTAPSDGWLLVTDRWAPGWSAALDGRPVAIAIGDFLFRAIRMSAGPHVLAMRYRPWGHPWIVAASWLCVFGVLAVSLGAALRRRAPRRRATAEPAPAQFRLDGTDAAS